MNKYIIGCIFQGEHEAKYTPKTTSIKVANNLACCTHIKQWGKVQDKLIKYPSYLPEGRIVPLSDAFPDCEITTDVYVLYMV